MSAHFERAELLFDQDRYDQAAAELHLHLTEDPNDAYAHSLMAISSAHIGRLDAALQHAHESIKLAPDIGYSHAALAQVEFQRNRYEAAAKAMDEAIRCMPFIAAYHGLLAAIRSNQNRWNDVLAAANQGLEYDPEDLSCLNMRALALRQLGDNAAACETIRGALAQNPNDPFTHANEGWRLLDEGNARQALIHFRESLRLQPELESARLGIIEALKGQNFLYRTILRLLLWLGKFRTSGQWGIGFGIVAALLLVQRIGRAIPSLAPLTSVATMTVVVMGFCLMFARPVSNFALLWHPLGRLAMTRDQVAQGVMTAILASVFFIFYFWSQFTSGPTRWFDDTFFVLLFLAVPALSIHDCKPGWPRWVVISLVFVGPLLFYLPMLLRGFGPSTLASWMPRAGLTGAAYAGAIYLCIFLVCSVLEDVEPVE